MQASTTASNYGLSLIVLFALLLLSLLTNIFLFNRGHESYSIKYHLLFTSPFFRQHPSATAFVQTLYHSFFALPFLLLLAIAIIRAASVPGQLATILLNGLIVLLTIYPTKDEWFYKSKLIIWVLVIGAQFDTLYQHVGTTSVDSFSLLSAIFYPINAIFFCLALLANQQDYWELNRAIGMCKEQLKSIYQPFTVGKEGSGGQVGQEADRAQGMIQQGRQQGESKDEKVIKFQIPEIFDGGIYGLLCRDRKSKGIKRGALYLASLSMLGLNAVVVALAGSSLGIVGLITNLIFDIFVFAFAALKIEERSVRNIFLLVFLGRILSFIFGQNLWIFGYCILYLLVGSFIGKILIDQRFPLKKRKKSKQQHGRQDINALKTPQFVLLILTAQIFFLVLAASLGVGGANISYSYSATLTIDLWNFALVAVMITWIIIIFMASYRIYQREKNNIRDEVQFYFGAKGVRSYHVAMGVTYLMVVGLGIYCWYFLHERTVFLSCLFLPLILLLLIKFEHQWEKNEYQVLADINEYNQRIRKNKKVILKKQQALLKQQLNLQSTQQLPSLSQINKMQAEQETSKMMLLEKEREDQNNSKDISETTTQLQEKEAAQQQHLLLKQKFNSLEEKPHNWRQFQGKIGPYDWFTLFLTPSDRWLLILMLLLVLVFAAYTITTYLVAGTIFGMLVVTCIVAVLTHSPFLRYCRTFRDLSWPQYIWYWFGWLMGAVYWAFYRSNTAFVVVWAGWYTMSAVAALVFSLLRNIKRSYVYLMVINILLTVLYVCLLLFLTSSVFVAGLVTAILLMLGIGAVPIAYNNLQGRIPLPVKLVCGLLLIGGVAVIAAIGFVFQVASNFAVFSFVMGAIYLVLFAIGCILYLNFENDKYETPLVYSSYGKPIYKFESRTEKLKSSISHKVIFDLSSIVLVVYSACLTLLFAEKQYAIYALGFYCCITFLQDSLFAIKTQNELALQRSKVTPQLVSKALKELYNKYMVDFSKNTFSKEVEKEKYRLKEAAEKAEGDDLDKSYLKLATKHQEYITNAQEQQKFLFFWIALIEFQLFTEEKLAMVKFINEVKEVQGQLMDYGIFIESLNFALSDFSTKFELVTSEVDSLHPFDYVRFKDIIERHQQLQLKKNEQQQRLAENIEKEQEKREDSMFNQLKEQLSKSSNQKINQFNNKVNGLQPKKRFIDDTFAADQSSLGPGLASIVSRWRRPKKGEMLVKGGFSPYDIKQGSIGDCYLVSSMGVLGEKWIKSALGGCRADGEPLGEDEWRNDKGAYMVRFHKFLKTVYVIVDDALPADNQDQFVFAKSEDPEEIWPCIIEKAYAKLYGGYYNIVEGKCHRVFAQFTGGFPSQLLTADYQANPNSLWQRITTSKDNEYLMAAGSPSHADGDRAHSARGIVQGHAYAILDARQVEGHRLMKLKNPHGSGGIEWTGDFSDGSEMMSKRLMQLLQHENKDDGVFWMKMEDFIYEFKSLYLCAIFSPEKWLQFETVESKFTQENSFGLPKASDQTFRNPQFGITVTKKCTFFVNMVQEAENSIQGKNTIYLRIQKNQGKRITKHNTRTDLLCGSQLRPVNAITISNEAQLQAEHYPYTFTLYVSTGEEGAEGEFKLQMYCSDKEAKLVPDAQFDREMF